MAKRKRRTTSTPKKQKVWWFDRLYGGLHVLLTTLAAAVLAYAIVKDPKLVSNLLQMATLEVTEVDMQRMLATSLITHLAAIGILMGRKGGYVILLLCSVLTIIPYSQPVSIDSNGYIGAFVCVALSTFRIAGWFGPPMK